MTAQNAAERMLTHLQGWLANYRSMADHTLKTQRQELLELGGQVSSLVPYSLDTMAESTEEGVGRRTGHDIPAYVQLGRVSFAASGVEVPLLMPLRGNMLNVLAFQDPAQRGAALDNFILQSLLSFSSTRCRITVIGTGGLDAPSPEFDLLPALLFRRIDTHRAQSVADFFERLSDPSRADRVGGSTPPLHVICIPNFPESLSAREAEAALNLVTTSSPLNTITILSLAPSALAGSNLRSVSGLIQVLDHFPVLYDDSLVCSGTVFPASRERAKISLDAIPAQKLKELVARVNRRNADYVSTQAATLQKFGVTVNVERMSGTDLRKKVETAREGYPYNDIYYIFQSVEAIKAEYGEDKLERSKLFDSLNQQQELSKRFSLGITEVQHQQADISASEDAILLRSIQMDRLCLLLIWEIVLGKLFINIYASCYLPAESASQNSDPSTTVQRFHDGNDHQIQRLIDAARAYVVAAAEQMLTTTRRPRPQRTLL